MPIYMRKNGLKVQNSDGTWVSAGGVASTATEEDVIKNKNDIASMQNETSGILAQAKEYVDGILPTASVANADTVGGLHADDFARSYNDELKAYLNGQSGDIRALVHQLPIGEYALNTPDSEFSEITFPIEGYCLMSWFPSKSRINDLIYGTLIIRPMYSESSVCATYICSVYNTYSYTDWEQISTTPIKKMSFPNVGTNAGGGGSLFSATFGTPITIACTSRGDTQCTPFYYRDYNAWLVLAKDAVSLDPVPAGSYSFDVWYI